MPRYRNHVILVGRLGADADMRSTATGGKIARLRVATDGGWMGRDAEARTEWHRVVAFGRVAAQAEKYFRKGDWVQVEGEIQYRTIPKGEGAGTTVTEVRARVLRRPRGTSERDRKLGE